MKLRSAYAHARLNSAAPRNEQRTCRKQQPAFTCVHAMYTYATTATTTTTTHGQRDNIDDASSRVRDTDARVVRCVRSIVAFVYEQQPAASE